MNISNINHVAIIMDGNGRWAEKRNRPRLWGHVRGSHVISKIITEADSLKIKNLTLYAFSTENWSRPYIEINTLFSLLIKFLNKERSNIVKNNIKLKVVGNLSLVPNHIKELILDIHELTKENDGLNLTFAFSYGSRDEIIHGINNVLKEKDRSEITEKEFSNYLYRPEIGDVDLLIRTGGEHRISNFLLWQLAYAELYFSETMWPNFTSKEFREIINIFLTRNRRFGQVQSNINNTLQLHTNA